MRQRDGLGRALLVKDIATVAAVVLPVRKGKGSPTPHANVGIDPFGGLAVCKSVNHPWAHREVIITYSTTVDHAACNANARGELVALALQCLVDLPDVGILVSTFGSSGPSLDQLEHLGPHLQVDGGGSRGLQERREVVHELAGRDLSEEVRAAILDACICELITSQYTRRQHKKAYLDVYSIR
jgi:hypothetical protein